MKRWWPFVWTITALCSGCPPVEEPVSDAGAGDAAAAGAGGAGGGGGFAGQPAPGSGGTGGGAGGPSGAGGCTYCEPHATLTIENLASSPEVVTALQARVCREDLCGRQSLASDQADFPTNYGRGYSVSIHSDGRWERIDLMLMRRGDGMFEIEAKWQHQWAGELRVGDRYSLEMVDAQEQTVASVRKRPRPSRPDPIRHSVTTSARG